MPSLASSFHGAQSCLVAARSAGGRRHSAACGCDSAVPRCRRRTPGRSQRLQTTNSRRRSGRIASDEILEQGGRRSRSQRHRCARRARTSSRLRRPPREHGGSTGSRRLINTSTLLKSRSAKSCHGLTGDLRLADADLLGHSRSAGSDAVQHDRQQRSARPIARIASYAGRDVPLPRRLLAQTRLFHAQLTFAQRDAPRLAAVPVQRPIVGAAALRLGPASCSALKGPPRNDATSSMAFSPRSKSSERQQELTVLREKLRELAAAERGRLRDNLGSVVLLSDKHPILTIGQELPPTFHYAWVILVH